MDLMSELRSALHDPSDSSWSKIRWLLERWMGELGTDRLRDVVAAGRATQQADASRAPEARTSRGARGARADRLRRGERLGGPLASPGRGFPVGDGRVEAMDEVIK